VDIWSAGAVIAELFTLIPLFPGSNDIDQIYRVLQVMGSPSSESWPGVDDLPDYKKVNFPFLAPVDLRFFMPHVSPADIAFLLTLLCLDPARRSSAEQAKSSSYFTERPLPCPKSELPVPNRKVYVYKCIHMCIFLFVHMYIYVNIYIY
jgi:cell cycle related kinase